jgi:hypothetical protein
MRKGFLVMLAVVLVAALAAPAMADTSLNGFVRSRAFLSNYKNNGVGYIAPVNNAPSSAYVDERARFLIKTGDENAKAVAQFELDQIWGDSAYTTGRNMGGGLEADTTNLETKNLYVWFKVPNTSVDFTVGVLNASDSYAGTFLGYADLAGVFANFKVDPVTVRLGYSKFWENATNKADDIDLYIAEAKFAPTKDVKLGLNLYFLNDMGKGVKGPTSSTLAGAKGAVLAWTPNEIGLVSGLRKVRVYMPGVDFAANAGPAALTGFAFYQFGKAESSTGAASVNVKGYAADVRADANLGPGKGFLELLYVSGDDNKTDTDYKGIITASNYNLAASFYARTDMQILLPNLDDTQTTSYGLAYDVANGGAGLFHVGAGYTQKLNDKLTGKVGAGYLAAAKKRVRDAGPTANFANATAMGTEVNANVNYNITKGLDFGVYGAYAWLGNAYKVSGSPTPDNLFSSYARLNYAF